MSPNNDMQALTVYAIDRQTSNNTIPVVCSASVKEDPAYYWGSNGTFYRLIPSSDMNTCINAVTWNMIPAWLSYVQTLGYTYSGELKPNREFFITGP